MKPINLLPYRPSTALADNPFRFFYATSPLSSNPCPSNRCQSLIQSSVSRHSLFRLTPIRLAITLVSVGVVPAWGAQTPIMSATVNTSANSSVNTLANTSATNSTLTTSSAAQMTANDSKGTTATQNTTPAATGQDSITTDANTAQPYLYQLNQQRVEDKIGQQLDNQTLADFNNFNQPVATLKQNQPSVGYSKALDQTTPQSVANQINNSKPASVNTQSQSQAQAQITEQLTTEKQNFDAINQKVSEQTNLSNQNIANQNIANQNLSNQGVVNDASNIKSTDTINPNDYLPAYQQQTSALTTPQANSTVTAESQGIVARLKNKIIGRGEGLNYIDISFANADAKLEPARNIKAALEKVTVESVSDFNASVNKLRQIAKDAAEAVGFYDTKIAFKHLGKDNIQVSLEVGKPVIVQNRIIDIRGEGGKGDNALPVYPVIEKEIPPKEGDVFSHGIYKAAKATIEGVAQTNGYFDAKWLNSSVDIILPDNTADVDLIYDTKTRYHFDDVKIYSIDKQGNLTDDPDKLPLKPKLMKALMTYQKGDAYYQPFVSEFTNNLTATRYFNGVDVDVIMPSDEAASDIAFEQSGSATLSNANSSSTTADNTVDNSDTSAAILSANSTDQSLASQSNSAQSNSSELQSAGTVDSTTQKTVNQVQDPNDIAPIQFEVDDSTEQRLNAISRKAKNLLAAPEDMELSPEAENKSKNPLVVIANAVSKTAKKTG
nr:POTRA domain-containing protein [Moraxella osloensis]